MKGALLGLLLLSAPAMAQEQKAETKEGTEKTSLGFRLDCTHEFNRDEGETQPCVSITGLRITHVERVDPKITAMVRLDPFAPPNASKAHLPDRGGLPPVRDTSLLLIDDYAIVWSPRPALEIAIEEYDGAARIRSVSGLALASPFQDAGYDQTAITVTYNLGALEGMRVKFAAGNGEGENLTNLDPQQYFGFEVSATLIQGLKASLGVSLDGNDVGSLAYEEEKKNWSACGIDPVPSADQGHSTQRLALGLELDGTFRGVEGLSVGLGFQRVIQADLDKNEPSRPTEAQLAGCGPLRVDDLFVEDAAGDAVNTVQKRVIGLSLRYRLLERYFVAADYETRVTDTGSVELFQVCDAFEGTTCPEEFRGKKSNKLEQTSITVGGGMQLSESLTLTLEYNSTSYDENYANAYYVGPKGKATDTSETFNARLAYNWQ